MVTSGRQESSPSYFADPKNRPASPWAAPFGRVQEVGSDSEERLGSEASPVVAGVNRHANVRQSRTLDFRQLRTFAVGSFLFARRHPVPWRVRLVPVDPDVLQLCLSELHNSRERRWQGHLENCAIGGGIADVPNCCSNGCLGGGMIAEMRAKKSIGLITRWVAFPFCA